MISPVIFLAFLAAAATAQLYHGSGHHVVHHAPQPYKFGYSIKDHHGEQHREESGDGGHAVKGSYGFTDDRGIHRQVNYVADHAGFRAQVKTNEPGTANQNPAAVHLISNAPVSHGHNGYAAAPGPSIGGGYGSLGYGYGGLENGYAGLGLGYAGLGNGGLGYGGYGQGGLGYTGLGYAGLGNGGLGYDGYGQGALGYTGLDNAGLGNGGLGYDGYGQGGL